MSPHSQERRITQLLRADTDPPQCIYDEAGIGGGRPGDEKRPVGVAAWVASSGHANVPACWRRAPRLKLNLGSPITARSTVFEFADRGKRVLSFYCSPHAKGG